MSEKLQSRVTFALNENRTLILGSQVLLGFAYEAFFEKGFHQVSPWVQDFQVGSLLMTLASALLLMAPTCFHRILGADVQTRHLVSFTTSMVEWALHPLALALGLSVYCVSRSLTGFASSAGLGVMVASLALLLWFIAPYYLRNHHPERIHSSMKYTTPVDVRLKHLLTESRVLLPGAQALLGFQLITFYMEDYRQLTPSLQWVHLISLLLIALAVILLIAPAAFHRIADSGEATERSYRFGSIMVLLSAVPLGLGLVGELFLVLAKVMGFVFASFGSLLVLLMGFGLWFGYALYVRSRG